MIYAFSRVGVSGHKMKRQILADHGRHKLEASCWTKKYMKNEYIAKFDFFDNKISNHGGTSHLSYIHFTKVFLRQNTDSRL